MSALDLAQQLVQKELALVDLNEAIENKNDIKEWIQHKMESAPSLEFAQEEEITVVSTKQTAPAPTASIYSYVRKIKRPALAPLSRQSSTVSNKTPPKSQKTQTTKKEFTVPTVESSIKTTRSGLTFKNTHKTESWDTIETRTFSKPKKSTSQNQKHFTRTRFTTDTVQDFIRNQESKEEQLIDLKKKWISLNILKLKQRLENNLALNEVKDSSTTNVSVVDIRDFSTIARLQDDEISITDSLVEPSLNLTRNIAEYPEIALASESIPLNECSALNDTVTTEAESASASCASFVQEVAVDSSREHSIVVALTSTTLPVPTHQVEIIESPPSPEMPVLENLSFHGQEPIPLNQPVVQPEIHRDILSNRQISAIYASRDTSVARIKSLYKIQMRMHEFNESINRISDEIVDKSINSVTFDFNEALDSIFDQSIMEYNGGAVVAMKGKDCVAIAADRRFGVQALTLATDHQKIFPVTDQCMVGLAGLATDVSTLAEKFRFKTTLYRLKEEREVTPKKFAHLVSSTLYERRFGPYYAEPIIAGLETDGTPFICSMDLIGCINFAKDFVVTGTTSQQLYGMCESVYEPNLDQDELFEAISQALLNAVDRDALSGWGAVVHLITKDKIITRTLRGRMD